MFDTVRPVSLIASLMPLGIAVFVVFVSFLPLGTSDNFLTLGPQFVLCVVYYWGLRAPHLLPPVAVFVLGLAIDLFSAGPLGFWGLVYLSTYALGLGLRDRLKHRGFLLQWLAFAGAAGLGAGLAWAMGSAYFAALLPPSPLAVSWAITVAAYPPLSVIFAVMSGVKLRRGV